MNRWIANILFTLFLLILSFVMSVMMNGCKTVEYIEVPKVSHDTLTLYETVVDSTVRTDSVFLAIKGDTVYLEKYRFLDRWHTKKDSIYICKIDTITNLKVEVREKELTKVQSFFLTSGKLFIFLLILLILLLITRFFGGNK